MKNAMRMIFRLTLFKLLILAHVGKGQLQYERPTTPAYKAPTPPYKPKPEDPGKPYGSDKKCVYEDLSWSDCDPFHLTRWRNRKLLTGPGCQTWRNETKQCSEDDLPPGVQWLVGEHKKCLEQMKHLQGTVMELHRWIDLINERGEAMYKAFAELRAHLEDIQRKIEELHKANHYDRELEKRLKKELEEWQERCRKTHVELEDIRARYEKMEVDHKKMIVDFRSCQEKGSECSRLGSALEDKIAIMETENRELERKLLDEERYREMVNRANARIAQLTDAARKLQSDIDGAKNDLKKCQIDVINAKHYKPPGYNRDTRVNLDMSMWITHNQTMEEKPYVPLIGYKTEAPKEYKPVEYQRSQPQPQVYTQKYTTTTTTTTTYTTTTTTTTTTTYTTTTTTTTYSSPTYPPPPKPSYQMPSYKPPVY